MDNKSPRSLDTSFLKTPPGPPAPIPAETFKDPLEFLLRLTRDYGDIAQFPSAYGPVYLVNHPDFVGHVLQSSNYTRGSLMKLSLGEGLLASEGPYWRNQRRRMQPAFHQETIAAFDALIANATVHMLEQWQASAVSAQPIDVAAEMTRLTFRVIGKALFGADIRGEIDELCDAVTVLTDDMGYLAGTLFISSYNVNSSRKRRFDEALQTVDRFAYRIITRHRQTREGAPNLLSMLLPGGDDADTALDDRQVRDEVVTMLLAGHVTTANMLTWTWRFLSENHIAEQRLHTELVRVLGGRQPKAQDIFNLQYTRRILQESLRLYPPVWFIARTARSDDEVGGYRIPPGAAVVVSPYTMHRHPCFWEKPEQFNPERFTPEMSENRPHYAYLPFGGGKHLCIGNHLAMLEGQLVLATVAQRYRLRVLPGQTLAPAPMLTLKPSSGLTMTLHPRSGCPIPSHGS